LNPTLTLTLSLTLNLILTLTWKNIGIIALSGGEFLSVCKGYRVEGRSTVRVRVKVRVREIVEIDRYIER
jgi:hypothetical protein